MIFGKRDNVKPLPLLLDNAQIEYVEEWKYLGTTLRAGSHLSFVARPDIASFFRATNSIVNLFPGVQEHVLITLLYSNCVPILTYACAVKEYPAQEMSNCNTAVNNALRKVFGFTRWESIRSLREVFGMKSLYEIFKFTQDKFNRACKHHSNSVIAYFASKLFP